MKTPVTDILCTQCGLCCNGSLFADVEITRTEAAALEAMGLQVDHDHDASWLLIQPCAALKGKRCSIYSHRPKCCRTFECKLLQQVSRGTVTIEQAHSAVGRALKIVRELKDLLRTVATEGEPLSLKERCLDALACALPGHSKSAELQHGIKALERVIKENFLEN